jgi:mono/diheme cytochrome c family protein
MAAPISYEVGGVQYVAVTVGTGGSWAMGGGEANAKGNNLPNLSRLLVFKLGGTATLPPDPSRPALQLAPPPATAPATIVARGETSYVTYCARCHARDAGPHYGILPDLRYSATLGSKDAWAGVVLGGQLAANGMASFASVLDTDDADAIRAYVIARANAALGSRSVPTTQ